MIMNDCLAAFLGKMFARKIAGMRTKPEVVLAPGLYKSNTSELVYTWNQLLGNEILEGGVVIVTDGVLSTSLNTIIGGTVTSNNSAPYLSGDLVLPSDGTITELKKNAFRLCSELTSIFIPNGVHTINKGAFYKCEKLSNVRLPSTLTTIDGDIMNWTFGHCTSLKSISLPKSLTLLGIGAFCDCINLETINIPDNITEISALAFSSCSALKDIQLHEGITFISTEAFGSCSSLTRVQIPVNAEVDGTAFLKCTGVKKYELTDGNPHHVVIDGNLYNEDGTILLFYACGKTDREVTLPEGLITIDTHAFDGCQYIETITTPSTLSLIFKYPFSDCAALTTMVMNAETPPTLQGESVFNTETLKKIVVPVGCAEAYKAAEYWSEYADIIVEEG